MQTESQGGRSAKNQPQTQKRRAPGASSNTAFDSEEGENKERDRKNKKKNNPKGENSNLYPPRKAGHLLFVFQIPQPRLTMGKMKPPLSIFYFEKLLVPQPKGNIQRATNMFRGPVQAQSDGHCLFQVWTWTTGRIWAPANGCTYLSFKLTE